jgi:hypothetical protein
MTNILQKHFSEPMMKGLAYFMASLIEENWDQVKQYTSITDIGKFILNKIFRGSGNLIFGNSDVTKRATQQHNTRKTWNKNIPIKFKNK